MAFFTCVKANVPILDGESDEDDTASESSCTLHLADAQAYIMSTSMSTSMSPTMSTPTPTVPDDHNEDLTLKQGLSTETVNTLTEEDTSHFATSSQTSTPTPNIQTERFAYEVDPELGAFV